LQVSPVRVDDPAEFAAIRAALQRIDRWRPEFAPAVRDLVDLRRLAADRLAAYRENPWAVGSRGQPVEHPALREFVAISVRVHQLTEALLLSPRSQARAGVGAEPERDPLEDLLGEQ
jgi:hypothetical protein